MMRDKETMIKRYKEKVRDHSKDNKENQQIEGK